MMASSNPTSSGTGTAGSRSNKLSRLRELQLRRNEARKLNHKEVVEEDRRKNLPKNHEAKRKRVEWEEEDEKKRKEAVSKGEDYDRVKLLDVGADQAERWDRMKKKKNPDIGFSDYEAATARQYQRLTKQIKPNMTDYEIEREKKGDEAFYPTVDTLVGGHKDTPDAIDRMVGDLEKQIDKRSKFSRRRGFDEEADIDYINERNMRFNKKLERFYGTYTTEIKQNLERGTAV
ncbi:pre-mRNA-splicing factor SYF2-like [Lineus longissimus]|uniref:pre-mRNA-splicing factor SYF2-like n=1 Tax=Lineus longissimus TaxID=88925 RepID=UPI002B4D5930